MVRLSWNIFLTSSEELKPKSYFRNLFSIMDPTLLLKCVSPRKTSIIFWKSHFFKKKKIYSFSLAAECLKEYTYGEYLTVLLFTRCCFTIKKEVAFIIKFKIFYSKLLQLGTWWQNATAGHSKLSHWDSLSQYLTSVWVLSSLLYWACYSNKASNLLQNR